MMKPTDKPNISPQMQMVIDRLLKLKYRINDAYKAGRDTDKSDKSWVMDIISDLRNGGYVSEVNLKVANEMWTKYAG